MALDFRANQVRTNKIISSGSTGTNAKILFYDIEADDLASPNQGNIDITKFSTSSIGDDVYFYVSGTRTTISYGPPVDKNIAVFGGDLYVSGTLMSNLTKTFMPIGSYCSTNATSSNPEVAGQAYLDITEIPNKSIVLRSILSVTTGSATAYVQLYNMNSNSYVEIGGPGINELSTTNTYPTNLNSVELLEAANFDIVAGTMYEIRVYVSTGSQNVIHGSSMFVSRG